MRKTGDQTDSIRHAQEIFHQNSWDDQRWQAIHLEWEALSRLGTMLLSGLLGRQIETVATRSDYYYWALSLEDSVIDAGELETLVGMIGGTEGDLEMNSNDMGFPIQGLDQGLCNRLFDKILPFDVGASLADDEGIWFFSRIEPQTSERS